MSETTDPTDTDPRMEILLSLLEARTAIDCLFYKPECGRILSPSQLRQLAQLTVDLYGMEKELTLRVIILPI